MLGFMGGLTALLYALRPVIYIGAFIAFTFAAFHNAGMLGKLFYNKAAVTVGAKDTYLLPPRDAAERLGNLRQSKVTIYMVMDDPQRVFGDLRMNFHVDAQLRNISRWTYGTAYFACRYPHGTSGVMIEVEKRVDINLKPGAKISLGTSLTSKELEPGIDRPEEAKCFIKDAFLIYEQT